MTNLLLIFIIGLLICNALAYSFTPSSEKFEPKVIRRQVFIYSGMRISIVRHYSTPSYANKPVVRLAENIPEIDPDTGLPYTTKQYRSLTLAALKPISP